MEPTPSVELVPKLPDAFTELVRDALLHVYDPAQLSLDPLLSLPHRPDASAGAP